MRKGYLKQNGVVCSPKCMSFAEYSLLAMFDTYPASKCTTQNMYMCVCAGLLVIVSLRAALGSLKEEERKMNNLRGRRFRFTTLETSVSHAKGIFKLEKNCLIILRWLKCRETLRQRRSTGAYPGFCVWGCSS